MFSRRRVLPDGKILWENYNRKGELHRIDGPAVLSPDGHKEWWVNGRLHRLDGPAVEFPSGSKYWWVDGSRYSEADFYAHLEKHHEEYGLVP